MPVGNAIVGGVLRSPLHRVMSRTLLLLTYQGQRTGREYTLPLNYARYGEDEVVVVAGHPGQKTWWTNIRGSLPVTLTIAGRQVRGEARLAKGEEAVPRLATYLERLPRAAKAFGLEVDADGKVPPDRLTAAAAEVQVVAVSLRP
jgi:deazaflavin-dependent oxidoreductase (nitroreductase family)